MRRGPPLLVCGNANLLTDYISAVSDCIARMLACHFYPTALKGCWGIVFTHGVRMGGRVGARREKVCPGCISETIRYRKLILGRDIG